jgi:hypothetical protein
VFLVKWKKKNQGFTAMFPVHDFDVCCPKANSKSNQDYLRLHSPWRTQLRYIASIQYSPIPGVNWLTEKVR